MRQCYQRGTDAACYCVNCEPVCVCVCIFFWNTCILKHVRAPEPQMEAGESSNKNWVVYQLSNLNSVHIWSYLLSPPPSPFCCHPLLLRVLPWQRRGALRLVASVSFPELWFCCWNCQSASQIRWRGGGDCVNIFWLAKMEGHLGGRGKGRKLAENMMLVSEGPCIWRCIWQNTLCNPFFCVEGWRAKIKTYRGKEYWL